MTTSTMMRAKTTAVTPAATCNAALGASATPDAPSRMLSTTNNYGESDAHDVVSIYNPAAPTRPAVPSTIPK
jgi:hypothetical protein